jgi:hypothetical protein
VTVLKFVDGVSHEPNRVPEIRRRNRLMPCDLVGGYQHFRLTHVFRNVGTRLQEITQARVLVDYDIKLIKCSIVVQC